MWRKCPAPKRIDAGVVTPYQGGGGGGGGGMGLVLDLDLVLAEKTLAPTEIKYWSDRWFASLIAVTVASRPRTHFASVSWRL